MACRCCSPRIRTRSRTLRGEHCIERAGELARAVPDQELDCSRALAEVLQEVTRRLRRPRAIRLAVTPAKVDAAGTVLDNDQGVEAVEQDSVYVDEVTARMPRA